MSDRNLGLDAARATAILLVLADHGGALLGRAWPAGLGRGLEAVRGLGYVGVTLFFALSGFLIGAILMKESESARPGWLRRFWARRWLRTLPNYYLFLGLNALLALWAVRPGGPDWRYLAFAQNLAGPTPPFFFESWSLSTEELFYLALPLAVLAAAALRPGRAAFARAAAALLAASLALQLLRTWRTPAGAWVDTVPYVSPLRLDALCWGVLAAWAVRRGHARGGPALTAGAAAAAASGVLLYEGLKVGLLDGRAGLAARLACLTLMSAGFAGLLPALSRWRSAPRAVDVPARRIAHWSYSMYLANVPLFFLARAALPPEWLAAPGPALAVAAAWAAATVAVAAATFHGFERPILRLRDRRLAPTDALPQRP